MIYVKVDYERKEYLDVLRQYFAQDPKQKKVFEKWYNRFFLWLIGSIQFKYKKFRVGKCDFKIDEHSIKRASKFGDLEKSWDEIEMVLELQDSYFIKTNSGAMPLPKRVLSDKNQNLFKVYAKSKLIVA
jgi:hypothetical protein